MYQDWNDWVKKPHEAQLSYELLQNLPRRLRKLIRRVERKCYSAHYKATVSLYDWTLFMTFLARECPNLTSLKLWARSDRQEDPGWVETCTKDAEWVQAILQIRSLTYFGIPVIQNGVIYDYPEFANEFLPWLKSCLEHRSSPCQASLQPLRGLKMGQLLTMARGFHSSNYRPASDVVYTEMFCSPRVRRSIHTSNHGTTTHGMPLRSFWHARRSNVRHRGCFIRRLILHHPFSSTIVACKRLFEGKQALGRQV